MLEDYLDSRELKVKSQHMSWPVSVTQWLEL